MTSQLPLHISFLVAATLVLSYKFQSIVPQPYLDEVFHIPQAQRYCDGKWMEWDDKITTPFGLYILSYIYTLLLLPLRPILGQPETYICSTAILRSLNAIGVAIVLPVLGYRVSRKLRRSEVDAARDAVSIAFFPLMFFFAGLFYTDVWSTVFVLAAYERLLGGRHGRLSAISILFRQTNVLWTSFFCVLHVVSQLTIEPNTQLQEKKYDTSNQNIVSIFQDIWNSRVIYNPPLAQFTDQGPGVLISLYSLALSILRSPLQAIAAALPFLTVILSFIAFVILNGGIVLGDKSAHTATLHLPQLFYFTLFVLFISWPLLIAPCLPLRFLHANFPLFIPSSFSSNTHSKTPHTNTYTPPESQSTLFAKTARTMFTLVILSTMLLIVHKNTVLHPYLLADNRHYPFYLFRRTILYHPPIKYLAVPIYYGCGWCILDSLQRPSSSSSTQSPNHIPRPQSSLPKDSGVSSLWFLSYLIAFLLSVIGAGLVEFRYFVPGWVLWRLAVGSSRWRWWLEMAWFAAVNGVTAYLFLHRGFSWESEPGKIQRFMW
ncbi:DIE2/ALG10 family-domain-containing protein [Kalaharituber pfeilii]|nr:DIE2/ALG10 family-domain-containing protein [Kalaharituber pfeilii]